MKTFPFAKTLIGALKKLDRHLWPAYSYAIAESMAQALSQNKLVIADVGAAGGTHPRWQPVESLTQFVTFEPDARSPENANLTATVNFTQGLGAEKGQKLLQLTQFPPASSVYTLNLEQLKDFANWEWHELTGSVPIELDTLDNCLSEHPELQPDFLKVDVEGADLDVLRGAAASLDTSIMGVQIEVSFMERHQGAPLFGEADTFLRDRGFVLFILAREHWLRQNLVYGANSHPQLVWADAVYFLKRDCFLERLRAIAPENQTPVLIKFIVILLSYGCHDYAIETIEAALKADLVSETIAQDLKQAVLSSTISPKSYVCRGFLGITFAMFLYLLSLPSHSLRQRTATYLKKQAKTFFHYCSKSIAREGIYGSSVADPY